MRTSVRNKSAAVPVVPAVHPEPILLSIQAAARTLGCTVWAVRSLLWDGKIPYVKIGRRFLVRPDDLKAFVERELGSAA